MLSTGIIWVDFGGVGEGVCQGGSGNWWGCSRILLSHLHKVSKIHYWVPQLKPVWLAPLLSDLIKGGLGAWSQKCMECFQVGCRGVFRQITSNRFQTCSSSIALCISCMNEVEMCFGKGFGCICALNRWSVQERTQTSFCPIACQVLHYLAWELCRQIAACILTKLTPFLLVWEVRKGRLGGGGGHFRSDAQNLHVTVRKNNFVSWVTRTKFTDYENIFAQRPKSFPSSHTQIEHAIPFRVYQGFALAPQM